MSSSFSLERMPDRDISFAKKLTTICTNSTHVLGCHTDMTCITTATHVKRPTFELDCAMNISSKDVFNQEVACRTELFESGQRLLQGCSEH